MNTDRNFITATTYPDKIKLSQFISIMKHHIEIFESNMNNIRHLDDEEYIEDIMDTFCKWMEIHKRNN